MVEEEEKKEEEKEIKEEVEKEKRKDKRNLFRWVGIIISIAMFVVLYFVKRNNETFPLGWVIIIAIAITIFGGVMMFMFNIYDKIKGEKKEEYDEEKLPPPIDVIEARQRAEILLRDDPLFFDYIEKIYSEGTEEFGEGNIKSQIYTLEAQGLYDKRKYVISINCHFPKKKYKILLEPNSYEVLNAKRRLASFPEEPMPTRTIEEDSPLTGVRRRIVETQRKERRLKREAQKLEGGIA